MTHCIAAHPWAFLNPRGELPATQAPHGFRKARGWAADLSESMTLEIEEVP